MRGVLEQGMFAYQPGDAGYVSNQLMVCILNTVVFIDGGRLGTLNPQEATDHCVICISCDGEGLLRSRSCDFEAFHLMELWEQSL